MSDEEEKVEKSEAQWREQLSDEEFQVARCSATERAFTGRYWDEKAAGTIIAFAVIRNSLDRKGNTIRGPAGRVFLSRLTNPPLVKSETQVLVVRIESVCAKCDAHLGHVFPDGPAPTGQRYCMNSASLRLEKDDS